MGINILRRNFFRRQRIKKLLREELNLGGIKRVNYRLLTRDKGTSDAWKVEDESHNKIVDDGIDQVGYALVDESAQYDTGLTYCAIGTDNTAPAAGDSTLGTETARETITMKSYTPATKTIALSTFFAASACSVYIKEAGIFGTSTAGAGADTGELFNRALLSFDNSGGTKDVTIEVDIVLSEVT